MTVRKRRPPPEGDIEVFGVDEQDAEPVELQRWVDLASNVLRDSGVRGEAELSLLFVNEEVIAELNGRFMGADGPPPPPPLPIHDPLDPRRSPDPATTGPDPPPPEVPDLPLLPAARKSTRLPPTPQCPPPIPPP